MSPREARSSVTVLGAGIVGICTALSLLERGVQVRLLDRGEPGQETSMGNAGIVSPWSFVPQAMPGTLGNIPRLLFGYGRPLSIDWRIAHRMLPWGLKFLRQGREDKARATSETMSYLCGPSIELYERHLQGTRHENLLCDSIYVHAFRDGSRANLTDLEYRIRQEKGGDLELIGRDRLTELEPSLSPDFNAAVLIHGQARVRSPGRLGQVLAEKAQSMGAEMIRTDIRSVRREAEFWKVECAGASFEATQIVVALGAWSTKLFDWLPFNLPLMAERGYHVEFPNPGIEINNSVMDIDAKVVASNMEGGVRVAGQAEFAPVDAPANTKKQSQLVRIAQEAFPGLNTSAPSFWMGRRPSFPDSLPVIGEVTGHEGLFVNFGHSHYGLMMAPKSGEVMAGLVTGERSNADLMPLSPRRF